MLNNFILQSCTAPGTGLTCLLIAATTGRLNFAQKFSSGASAFYFLDDGTQAEWGIGTLTTGSPDLLARSTVLGNTAGTTARLNFAGVTRVYNELPAESACWRDASGRVSFSLLSVIDSVGSVEMVSLSGSSSNGASIHMLGNGTTTPGKYIRVASGLFQIVNSTYTAAIASLTDAGEWWVPSVRVRPMAGSTAGYMMVNSGDASHTGYASFWNAAGVRQGYIGYGPSGGNLILETENSASGWATSGAFAVGGQLTVANDGFVAGSSFSGLGSYFSTNALGTEMWIAGDSVNRSFNFTATGWKINYQATGAGAGRFALFRSDGTAMFYSDVSGNFTVLGNVSAANVSDERTKRDIAPYTRGLADIIALEPISYRYNGQGGTDENGPTRWGVSAQQAQPFIPEAVYPTPEPAKDPTAAGDPASVRFPGQLSFNEQPLLYAMVNAIKDLSAQVASLQSRIAVLEGSA